MKRTAITLALALIALTVTLPAYSQDSNQPQAGNQPPAAGPGGAQAEKRKQRRQQIREAVKKKVEEIKEKAGQQGAPAQ